MRWRASMGLALLALLASAPASAFAKDDPAPPVSFLDGDAGRAAIVDESIEPYFSVLGSIEMAAKTGRPLEATELAAQRDECRKRYAAAVEEFTAAEKEALQGLTAEIGAAWASEYPLFAKTPWSFLKVSESIEGGLPHTRGRSIVFSPSVTAGFANAWKADPKRALAGAAPLLVHEQSHVVQRLHPEVFAPLYVGGWGFVRAKGLASDPWLDRLHLGNPDGIDVGWAFPLKEGGATTLIQPLVVFTEGPEPRNMPQDMQMIAVTLEKKGAVLRPKEDAKGKPIFRAMPLAGFDTLFGGIGETFHPNEIFACLFSAMVARDHFHGGGLSTTCDLVGKDFSKLRPWCREHFAVKEPAGAK